MCQISYSRFCRARDGSQEEMPLTPLWTLPVIHAQYYFSIASFQCVMTGGVKHELGVWSWRNLRVDLTYHIRV